MLRAPSPTGSVAVQQLARSLVKRSKHTSPNPDDRVGAGSQGVGAETHEVQRNLSAFDQQRKVLVLDRGDDAINFYMLLKVDLETIVGHVALGYWKVPTPTLGLTPGKAGIIFG